MEIRTRLLLVIRPPLLNQTKWIGIAVALALTLAACGGQAPADGDRAALLAPSPLATAPSRPEQTRQSATAPPIPTVTSSPVPTVMASPTVVPRPTRSPESTAAATLTATPVPTAKPPPTAGPAPVFTFEMREGTVARYLVREQLAGVDLPGDAVGETTGVTGRITFAADGSLMPEMSRIEIDLRSLRSDSDKRDKYLRGKSLESDLFPTALFVPLELTGLTWPLPTEDIVTFAMGGEMTVRDVTRPIVWTVEGSFDGQRISGKATTRFTFGEFQMEKPSVFVVISVEDDIRWNWTSRRLS